jgi:2-isopropylmalate synthase
MIRDIEPIVRISQDTGLPIEACLFIGSSPIRQYAEGWDEDFLLKQSAEAINYAVEAGLPVMYVTEDTSRARPETVRKLYGEAVRLGVKRVCVTDTVGHATPAGATRLIGFVREVLDEAGGPDVGIDWHGHRDRGMGLANCIAAYRAGATRVHGCGLGIGERCGNAEMDLLLVNLRLLGWIDRDLTQLADYCLAVSEAVGVPIVSNYPVVGSDAFETATGVHAAAVIKAYRKGDAWLADRIYSGVAAGEFGFKQKIRIGPMSGRSNVSYWLEERSIEATEERIDRIFQAAKQSDRLLEEEEIFGLLEQRPAP